MDPVTAGILSAVLGIGADALGELWAKSDKKKRDALLQQAQQIYQSMSPPQIAALQAQQTGPSAFENLTGDYGNKEARNRALRQIMGMGEAGGMDPGSVLALEGARRASAQQAAQQEQAITQEYAARGLGGAGEGARRLQAQQGAAQRDSLAGLQAASDARSRALQALMAGGGLAQQAESADAAQAANRAAGMDAFQRFNAEQRQATNQFNAGLQQQNWNNQLGVADRNYGALRARAGDYETEAEMKRRRARAGGQAALDPLQQYGYTSGGGTP